MNRAATALKGGSTVCFLNRDSSIVTMTSLNTRGFQKQPPSQGVLMNSSEGPLLAAQATDTHDDTDHGVTQNPYQHGFSPYDFNGGTAAAVAGPDYCIFAADTRLSSGYEILSRDVSKLHALTPQCVLASAGCKTDVDQLRNVLDFRMKVSKI